RTSSPASIRTEAAFVWSRNASRLTAGSSGTASSRKRRTSAIDRLLERFHADAAVGVDEPFAGLADLPVALDRAFDSIDNPFLVETGAGDLGLRRVLVARTAEQQLVVLLALTVDAEDADVARMVVAAGVDAARNLELELADIGLPVLVGEAA